MSIGEALLPGEDRATTSRHDVEHWLGVYTMLVARCREHGFNHGRFEERMRYWRRLHDGDTQMPPPQVRTGGPYPAPAHRCPFARMGVNSDVIAGCPGFEAAGVSFQHLTGGEASTGTSCLHMRTFRSGRGFAAVCGHPDGLPPRAGAPSAAIEVAE